MKETILEKRLKRFLAGQLVWDITTNRCKCIKEAIMRKKFDWDRATSIGIDYIETSKGVCK